MNITCIICSDILAPSAEIYVTPCGHLFHYACLIQWIERSKTCPQCRYKTPEKSLHRVYFNLANTENLEDAGVLQHKLDNLQFQMNLKEKDITNFKQKYEKYKENNKKLREEICVLEEKQRTNDSIKHRLQDKLNFFRSQVQEKNALTEEITRLRDRLKDVEAVQLAINGSREEVNDMLRNENNIESLAILAATLKKALLDTEKRKHNYEYKAKQLQNEVSKQKRHIVDLESKLNDLNLEFENAKTTWGKEKEFLTEVVNGINKDTPTRKKINSALPLKRILSESPMPLPKRPVLDDSNAIIDLSESISYTVGDRVNEILDSDSPYLPVKTNSLGINLSFSSRSNLKAAPPEVKNTSGDSPVKCQMSIFKPKSRQLTSFSSNESDVVYNGLGGHSKTEKFPSPKKSLAGMKRHKTATISSAKLRKLTPNAKK